jgi:hypothetical protein
MSWQFLGTLGVSMVVAAFLGGGLAISNVVKIPVVRTREGFVALIIGGLLITGMGYLTWREQPPLGSTQHENAIVQIVNRVMDTIDNMVRFGGGGSRPVLTLVPQSGPKTRPIQIQGAGFQPDERVEIRVHSKVLAKPVANESGAFSVTIAIPASSFCPEGQCEILAAGDQSLKWTTEPYDVSP